MHAFVISAHTCTCVHVCVCVCRCLSIYIYMLEYAHVGIRTQAQAHTTVLLVSTVLQTLRDYEYYVLLSVIHTTFTASTYQSINK
jgi:hypothetical protein